MNNKTEYRIVTKQTTFCEARYLQFKSSKRVHNFPCFWKTREVVCWRFIPEEMQYIFRYVDEKSCPTILFWFDENHYLCCFLGHENFAIMGITWFTRRFPDIQDYFRKMNRMRDEYLKEGQVYQTGTTYLNDSK